MSSVSLCLLKHFGPKSPVAVYRAEMAEDARELIDGGMGESEAWERVVTAKLTGLKAERSRIEQDVADAYAKTPAGKPAELPTDIPTLKRQWQDARITEIKKDGKSQAAPTPSGEVSTLLPAPEEDGERINTPPSVSPNVRHAGMPEHERQALFEKMAERYAPAQDGQQAEPAEQAPNTTKPGKAESATSQRISVLNKLLECLG